MRQILEKNTGIWIEYNSHFHRLQSCLWYHKLEAMNEFKIPQKLIEMAKAT
jgi:hypothetical protein